MSTCTKCGHDHQRLGLEIAGGVLLRTATSAHRVKTFGGAWAFATSFWDTHRAEFDRVQIVERDSGHIWHTHASAFERAAIRRTLSAAFGPQVILPLVEWNRLDDTGAGDGAQLEDAAPVQLILGLGQTQRTVYEKAKAPRPRIYKAKKPWGRGI